MNIKLVYLDMIVLDIDLTNDKMVNLSHSLYPIFIYDNAKSALFSI